MSLVEELTQLLKIRNSFYRQLADLKSTQKGYCYQKVVSEVDERVAFILYTLSLRDQELKGFNIKKLQDSRAKWFNSLCKDMLTAVSVSGTRDYITLTEIFYAFKELLK